MGLSQFDGTKGHKNAGEIEAAESAKIVQRLSLGVSREGITSEGPFGAGQRLIKSAEVLLSPYRDAARARLGFLRLMTIDLRLSFAGTPFNGVRCLPLRGSRSHADEWSLIDKLAVLCSSTLLCHFDRVSRYLQPN